MNHVSLGASGETRWLSRCDIVLILTSSRGQRVNQRFLTAKSFQFPLKWLKGPTEAFCPLKFRGCQKNEKTKTADFFF